MKYNEIIDSGLLELYALGTLESEELSIVEKALADSPEVAQEFDRIQSDLANFAHSHQLQPSKKVKDKIFETISQKKSTITSISDATAPQTGFDSGSTVWFWQIVAAAAILLFFISSAYAFWITSKFNQTSQQLAVLQDEQQVWSETLQKARSFEIVLGNPDFERIDLSGDNGFAMVYWNKKTQEVFVEASGLPALNYDESYQLWSLYDSAPYDAGVFNKDQTGETESFFEVKRTQRAQAFAITIESRGGNPTPTLSRLVVSGAVNS